MTEDANILVRVGADIETLRKDLRSASERFKSFSGQVVQRSAAFAKYSAVATSAMAATTAAIVSAQSKSIDHLAKTADALGINIGKLQALNHVAELNGVSAEQLAKGLQRMERGLGEASRKGGASADALEDVGVSIKDIINLRPDEQIQTLANALVGIENQSMRASIASDLFGRDGVRMLKVLTQLRKEGVEPTSKELDRLGVTMSRIDAAQVEAANDAFFKARQVIDGAAKDLTVKLAPYIEEVANRFTEAARESGGFGDEIESAVVTGIRAGARLADFVRGLQSAFKAVELVATGFGAAAVSVFELVATAVTKFADMQIDKVNLIIDALNKIPRVDIAKVDTLSDSAFMQGLHALGDTARTRVGEVRAELYSLAMQEMPSDKVEAFLTAVAEKSQQAAAEVVKANEEIFRGGAANDGEKDDGFDARIESILSRYETEQALEREHQQIMADIEKAWQQQKIASEQEYLSVKDMAHADYIQKKKSREEAAERAQQMLEAQRSRRMNSMLGAFQSFNNLMGGEDKKRFEKKKKMDAAVTGMSTAVAAIESFKNAGGYPWGLVPAGAMIATGLKAVNDINSTSFNGGSNVGSLSSGAGGAAASSAPAQQPAAAPAGGVLTVEGLSGDGIMSMMSARTMAEMLLEHQRNGGEVVLAA
ncbi:hypothetical protein [Teredinibacter turnerae]|uniref:hypothetical protein n=1 Tax=Teredinibacter turnerae TaxID=2426 RepID=UPI0030CEBB47